MCAHVSARLQQLGQYPEKDTKNVQSQQHGNREKFKVDFFIYSAESVANLHLSDSSSRYNNNSRQQR